MNEEKETNIETQEPQIPEDALPEEDEPEEMDLEEAKAIARLLAQAMIASEAPGQAAESADVPAATDTEIPDQAAESENTPADPDAKSSVPVWKRIFRKTVPSGRRFAIPIVIAEILMLTALVFVIGKYALFTSDDTVQFAQKNAADNVTCADGVLIYNDVRAKVPTDGNLKYNISYKFHIWISLKTARSSMRSHCTGIPSHLKRRSLRARIRATGFRDGQKKRIMK